MYDANNQETFRIVLKAFSEAAAKNNRTYAYEAGFLESLSARMLSRIPKKYQRDFIDELVLATQKQEQALAHKTNQSKTNA